MHIVRNSVRQTMAAFITPWRRIWVAELELHAFLMSALDGGEWSASCRGHLSLGGKNPGAHWILRWVGPRGGPEMVSKWKNPCPSMETNPGRPVHRLVTILTNLSGSFFWQYSHILRNTLHKYSLRIKPHVSPGFVKQVVAYLFSLCCNDSLVTWTVVSLTASKFKPLILIVCGSFNLSRVANICIVVILYDGCLLPA
jgi:hypothetical protein